MIQEQLESRVEQRLQEVSQKKLLKIRQGSSVKQQQDETPSSGPYRIENGCIVRIKHIKDELIAEPLCNFNARVTEEVILDDGVETTRAFVIEGQLDNGETLSPAISSSNLNLVELIAILQATKSEPAYATNEIKKYRVTRPMINRRDL